MSGVTERKPWLASHRVVLKASSGTIHCLCVMLDREGDAWTRFDWLHHHPPTLRRMTDDHWAINRHNLQLAGRVYVMHVDPLNTPDDLAA